MSQTTKRDSLFEPTAFGGGRLTFIMIFLGCLAALPPLAVEASLPALPAIADDLETSLSMAQWSFTGMFVGMALGQLFAGPFCDRLGRRPVLLSGLASFVVAGLGCAFAPSIEVLIAYRFLQGFGASVGVLVSKAIPRDLWTGPAATERMSFVTSMSAGAMMCGPIVGSLLLQVKGWRGVLSIFPLAGAFLLIVAWIGFPETLPRDKRFQGSNVQRYRAVLGARRPMLYLVANSFLFAAMAAFITGSPSVLMVTFEMSLMMYGLTYSLAVGCVTVGSFLNGLLARRSSARCRLLTGIGLAVVALLVLGATTFSPDARTTLLGGAIFAMSCGFNYPNSQAAGLAGVPRHAGVGAGIIGTLAYLMGALSSGIVGLLGPESVLVLVVTMSTFALLGVGLLAALDAGREMDQPW